MLRSKRLDGQSAFSDGLSFLHFLFFSLDRDPLMLDIQPQSVMDTHVNVRHPDQGKESQQVATPIVIEQLETGDDQENHRHAGKQKENLTRINASRLLAPAMAIFPWLAEYFFVRAVHATHAVGIARMNNHANCIRTDML
jgi:hypothetical protein